MMTECNMHLLLFFIIRVMYVCEYSLIPTEWNFGILLSLLCAGMIDGAYCIADNTT